MKPRDLRISHLRSSPSVRRSFDTLTLPQDDKISRF